MLTRAPFRFLSIFVICLAASAAGYGQVPAAGVSSNSGKDSPGPAVEVSFADTSSALEDRIAGYVDPIQVDACEIEFVDERKVKRVQRAMKPDQTVTALAETYKLLGDPTRIKIAFALSREDLCICDLANLLGVSQSAVSHSLRALRQMRLVRFRKEGKIAYYALDDDHIAHLLDEGFRRVEELL